MRNYKVGKIHKNQVGCGVIEGLLVVIALTLIVGVGFYVVNANKNRDNQNSITSSTEKPSMPEQKDPYSGWQTYTDKDNKGCFRR